MFWLFIDSLWFRELYWVFAAITMFNIDNNPFVMGASCIFAMCAVGFAVKRDIEMRNNIELAEAEVEGLNVRFIAALHERNNQIMQLG